MDAYVYLNEIVSFVSFVSFYLYSKQQASKWQEDLFHMLDDCRRKMRILLTDVFSKSLKFVHKIDLWTIPFIIASFWTVLHTQWAPELCEKFSLSVVPVYTYAETETKENRKLRKKLSYLLSIFLKRYVRSQRLWGSSSNVAECVFSNQILENRIFVRTQFTLYISVQVNNNIFIFSSTEFSYQVRQTSYVFIANLIFLAFFRRRRSWLSSHIRTEQSQNLTIKAKRSFLDWKKKTKIFHFQVKHYDNSERGFTVVHGNTNDRKRYNYDRIRAVLQS